MHQTRLSRAGGAALGAAKETESMSQLWDVLIVGAGPAGLASAIEAGRQGLKALVLEKGCLTNSIYHYPVNMVFFTSRELLEIGVIPFACANLKPTRMEALEYYRRVTDFYRLNVHFQERVIAVEGADGEFRVGTQGREGARQEYRARKVVLATGYYDLPNLLGVPGEDLPKVSHYYTEAHPFFRSEVAVIGGGNSAAEAALDLYRHGAAVTLIQRGKELSPNIKYWVRPDLENRLKEGAIRALFETTVQEIRADTVLVVTARGESLRIENDFVFALTGYHPDFDFLRRAGVALDPQSQRPCCDVETRESNVPGIYLAGVIVAGMQTNEIFIENGRFHGQQIVADIKRKI
jgi:thioredoxin reductase (NADPH)